VQADNVGVPHTLGVKGSWRRFFCCGIVVISVGVAPGVESIIRGSEVDSISSGKSPAREPCGAQAMSTIQDQKMAIVPFLMEVAIGDRWIKKAIIIVSQELNYNK
jgi:ABC-type arginine/histidine transport system permease subunit